MPLYFTASTVPLSNRDNRQVALTRKQRIPLILDALWLAEADPAVGQLVAVFGDDPVEIAERHVGEPAHLSRRLLFASGGEIILHDDMVVQVLLRLTPTSAAPQGLDLSEWVPKATNDATLDVLQKAFTTQPHYSRPDTWYFALDGGYVEFSFAKGQGWKTPKNLESASFTVDKPGLACSPADDDCPACSDILVRVGGPESAVDVDGTVASLTAAISDGRLKENNTWVALNDLTMLHASRLMERVESQLTCTVCRRITCFTLFRDAPATFGYYSLNDAQRRPLEAIPPVELWGDEARITQDRDAMHYVDHEAGSWFLVEQQDTLYLDARYVVNSMVDLSALIALTDVEVAAYRDGGHDYLSRLATKINNKGPHLEDSPYRERNLLGGADEKIYRAALDRAIINHTWAARQRQASSGI